jgi:hypothetical protein
VKPYAPKGFFEEEGRLLITGSLGSMSDAAHFPEQPSELLKGAPRIDALARKKGPIADDCSHYAALTGGGSA